MDGLRRRVRHGCLSSRGACPGRDAAVAEARVKTACLDLHVPPLGEEPKKSHPRRTVQYDPGGKRPCRASCPFQRSLRLPTAGPRRPWRVRSRPIPQRPAAPTFAPAPALPTGLDFLSPPNVTRSRFFLTAFRPLPLTLANCPPLFNQRLFF